MGTIPELTKGKDNVKSPMSVVFDALKKMSDVSKEHQEKNNVLLDRKPLRKLLLEQEDKTDVFSGKKNTDIPLHLHSNLSGPNFFTCRLPSDSNNLYCVPEKYISDNVILGYKYAS